MAIISKEMADRVGLRRKVWLWKWKGSPFSRVWLFATPWTVACQASLSMGILQARILEWVAIPFSRIFLTQGSNPGLLPCTWILYGLSHQWLWKVYIKGQKSDYYQVANWTADRVPCRAWRLITSLVTSILFSSQTQWVTCGSMIFSEPQFIYLEKERAVQLGLWDLLWM